MRWVDLSNGLESDWMDSRVWMKCYGILKSRIKWILMFVEVCEVWIENCKMRIDELCFWSKEW
mgnify:CR=1 FL=1